MPKTAESKHAPALRERGFEPVPQDLTATVRSNYLKTLTRQQRRHLARTKLHPSFTMSELATFATDENGVSWSGPPYTDLADLGFKDNSQGVFDARLALRRSDRRYN